MKSDVIIIVFLLLISGSPVSADTTIHESYHFYEISIDSSSNLINELDAKTPVVINNKIFHAYTSTSIEWTFGWVIENNACHVTWVNTSVNIVYTLPKLQNNQLEPSLKHIWKQWYGALQKHEQNHGKLAIKTAEELESSLRQLPRFSNCNRLEDYANRLGRKYIQILEDRTSDYDKRTNHGETEGARLSTYF